MRAKLSPWALAVSLLVALGARADTTPFVPQALPQEGRLLGANDQPVTGAVDMTFRLYHEDSGGTAVWSEEQTIQVDNGYYAIRLGDPADTGVQPITADILVPPVYLAISVGGAELSPRLQLGTVPYAQRADLANRIDGGTISNATITNSSVDATSVSIGGKTVIDSNGNVSATSLSIGGNTVIDSNGNVGGKSLTDYVTNETLTGSYSTSADLASQEYDNRVRNGSFELGQAGAVPTDWDSVGAGTGTRGQKADAQAPFGANVLEIANSGSSGQVAVQQVVIPQSAIAAAAGETFTASVVAAKVSGPQGRPGRLCLTESDGDPAPTCVALTLDSGYLRATISHPVSQTATYLAVLLDPASAAGDTNTYDFDGVMVTRGALAPPFAANMAEQVPSALPDQSIPASALPADVALLDAPSDAFTGDVSAPTFSGSGAGLTSLPAAQLTGIVPDPSLPTDLARTSGGATFDGPVAAPSFSGDGSALTNLDASQVTGTFSSIDSSGAVQAQSFTGDGVGLTNVPATSLTGAFDPIGIGVAPPRAALDAGHSTDAIILPTGTTAQRPANPVNGMLRYNTDTPGLEAYIAGQWVQFAVRAPPGSKTLSAAGGTSFTVPPFVTEITVNAWGAGGGGGGGGGGGPGGGGAYATSTITVSPGETLTVIVGGGGGGGQSAVCGSGGGAGGTGSGGIGAGGAGGNAGPNCSDMSGGGGGGGSFVLRGSTILVAAGGGGGGGGYESPSCNGVCAGGGGGGQNGAGGQSGGMATSGGAAGASGSTNGAGGAQDSNDGPGAGGGGGGLLGGGGGGVNSPYDNYAAGGGGGGTSQGDAMQNGNGSTPGDAGDADRGGSAGNGGGAQAVGAAGLVKLSW